MSEDIGELIIIYDAEDEMAQESFPLHPLRFLMIFTLVKSTIPEKKKLSKNLYLSDISGGFSDFSQK